MVKAEQTPTTSAQHADDELFRDLYLPLRRFAAVVGSLSDDPDDLVQEAVAAALRQGNLTDLDNPKAYLRRTIANLVVSNTRKDGLRSKYAPTIAASTTNVDVYPSDLAELMRIAPMDRAVVYLADVEGLPFDAVAEAVGLSTMAVRLRASRARRQLRQLLEVER